MGRFQDFVLGTNSAQLRKSAGNPNGNGSLPGVIPPDRLNSSGEVQFKDAFGLAAVYAAVRIYAASFMQMRFVLIGPDGKKVDPSTVDGCAWLLKPNARTSLPVWLAHYATSQASNGNAYWKVTRNAKNQVINAQQLDPLKVHVELQDEFGNNLQYSYNSKKYAPGEIDQVQGLPITGAAEGLGPIQAAKGVYRSAIDTAKVGQEFFANGGIPEGVITMQGNVAPEVKKEAAKSWVEARKNGRTAVMDNSAKYEPVLFSPEDMQFIQIRQFDRTEIAIMYGLAGNLIYSGASGESITYQNVDDAWINQSRFGLGTIIRGLEAKASEWVPRGYSVKLNQDSLLRPDTAARYLGYSTAVGGPWMLENEAREIEDMRKLSDKELTEIRAKKSVIPKTADKPDAAAA